MKSKLIALFFLFVMASAFYINSPRKVVFLGDSLTEAGNKPGGYIEMMREELKKRGLDTKYELIGAGVGGSKIRDVLPRFEKDVVAHKPDLVFIMLGINDVGFFRWHPSEGGTPADQFELGLKYMVKRIQQKGGAAVLCSPTVIEEKPDGTNPMDKELDQYRDIVQKVALETGSPFCDTRSVFINYLKENNKEKKLKDVLTTDHVHLNEKGNRLLAESMIKYLK